MGRPHTRLEVWQEPDKELLAPGHVVPGETGVEEAVVAAPPPVLPVRRLLVHNCCNTILPSLPQSGSCLPVPPACLADIVVDHWLPVVLLTAPGVDS